jgi:hypothetical protein
VSRYLALMDDPIAGGTTYDEIVASPAALLTPAVGDLLVVTTGQVDIGKNDLTRDNDVRGTRANSAPISFASAPSMTFDGRAWTSQLRKLLRKAMGGTIANTGAPPAAVQSTVQMLQDQMGDLPALQGFLVREGQIDRMTGLWVNELTLNFPADAEGTMSGNLMGLYHDVDDVASVAGLPSGAAPAGQSVAYMLRDIVAVQGPGAGVSIDCLGGFGLTINNNLSTDFRTRFCAGRNIYEVTIDGTLHRVWYPDINRLGAQTITGRLDFGNTRPDREARRIASHADKLVVELYGDPLGTTPAADEMVRLILHKQAPTGGGADPLGRDGDIQSSYEFTAYVDDVTGKDLEAVIVGTTAVV